MWKNVLDYFETLDQHPVQRMLLLISGMLILWIFEGAIPFISLQYKKSKWRHASVNITFFVLDFFGGWLVHVVQHKTYALWKFHVVHHSDNNVDVTTGLRHHPIESVLRGLFFLMGIALSGAPVYAVMIYQTVLILATQFTHANIHLPKWLDKPLSYFIVSPGMHKVHHHWQQPYTDSNYGAVLAIWDRMFGTYRHLDQSEIRYGLDRYYPNEHDENLMLLMRKPFEKMK